MSGETELSEVERLRGELAQSQEKLVNWKQRTQRGVDELRQMVTNLTEKLEQSDETNRQLHHFLSDERTMLAQYLEEGLETGSALTLRKWDLFTSSGSPPAGAESDLETYKRRTETTLRLQAKTCETLQQKVLDLQNTIDELHETVKEKESALTNRDEALGSLSVRLEAAESAARELENQQRSLLQGPDMEKVSSIESRLESELQKVSESFVVRENLIHQQHNEEIQRLLDKHEVDMNELQKECEKRVLAAMNESRAVGPVVKPAVQRDDAYQLLLTEKEGLTEENRKLKEKLEEMKDASAAAPPPVKDPPVPTGSGVTEGASAEASAEKLKQLTNMVHSLSAKLCELKEENKELRGKQSLAGNSGDTLDAQQTTYLRSILKQMLSHRTDEHIFSRTIPVVATLLSWSENEVNEIRNGV
ncbi:hypothetical protein AGDE_08805 [Angomonas deanei]|nr:hypothetical protein AGDE_08805 [Angomonas deanei]|eukprot:EPY32213.1 hypothetical protein AGDE_08805 [Angomonas deanei]